MEEKIYTMNKDDVFKIIQTMLKNPPVVIWGSGATIPFGMPSMYDLNTEIGNRFNFFDASTNNLEEELGKDKYRDSLPDIRKFIWKVVEKKDNEAQKGICKNDNCYLGVKELIERFIDVEPQVLNIITTNYDRVLENVMAFNNINFTDGFNGRNLSYFDEDLFINKKNVNLIKVHGSLNWFNIEDEVRYSYDAENTDCIIIPPGKNKYQEVQKTPYRELIQKSDTVIKNAKSLFVVGFGFNDEHLTPKIKMKIKNNCPIILITKKITETTETELKNAKEYVLLEEDVNRKTKIRIKKRNETDEEKISLEGDYWQLNKFLEVI